MATESGKAFAVTSDPYLKFCGLYCLPTQLELIL